MISRTLRLSVAFTVAVVATKAEPRVPHAAGTVAQTVVAARTSSKSPESAHVDGTRGTELLAANSRAQRHAGRESSTSICPEAATLLSRVIAAHARTSGLAAIPAEASARAIPFDATAPPRSA